MDAINILLNTLATFWYVIPILILLPIIKTPWFKGMLGEFLVNILLSNFLPKKDYRLIKHITLPTEDGGTTQIDHIVVSRFGIFVIETKNMKGWIFGKANQKQWTQKIFKYSGKFQNPIHQNYKHLKTLESCLNVNPDALFSVIVFIGDSQFKTEMPENVTYARGSVEYIKSKEMAYFSDHEVEEIIKAIESGRLERSFKTNREHVAHVKKIVKDKQSEQICPKCGSEMRMRVGKKGENAGNKFLGCSTFPKCRGMLSL